MTEQLQLDLAKALAHEEALVFDAFDEDIALELGLLIRTKATAPIIVDIRRGEELVFFSAMPGTAPANADWARRKRNLVNRIHTSSYVIGLWQKLGNDLVASMALDPRDHTPHGGCFPIRVAGAGLVGTVTVSGLPQREDHKLATDCIAELLGIDLGETRF